MRRTIQRQSSGRDGRLQHFHGGRLGAAVAVILILMAALAPGAFAQDAAPAAAPVVSHNRFLFVVDTSSSMKKFADDTQKTLENLIRSAADGQLHAGDSIGLWTFNKDVYTGKMALQTWTPGDSEEIALRVGEFLHQQKFENDSRMDQAMSAIGKVVKLSDVITVVMVSDGKHPIMGTPYDDDINRAYIENLQQMKKNAKPVVTVLQGRSGKFTKRYTVTSLEWGIVVPDLPIAIKGADAAEAAQQASTKPAQTHPTPAKGPAMILVGPQPSEVPAQPAVTATAPAVTPVPAAPGPETAPVMAQTTTVAPAPAPAPTVPETPAPATVAMTPAPAPAPAPVSTPAVDTAPTASVTRQMSPESYVNPGHQYVPPPPAATQPPIAPEPTAPAPAATVSTGPAPTVVPLPAASSTTAKPAAPAVVAASASKPAAPAVVGQAGGSVKSLLGDHQTLLLIGGIVLVVVALGLVMMMFRRPAARVSLISQTMNNQAH